MKISRRRLIAGAGGAAAAAAAGWVLWTTPWRRDEAPAQVEFAPDPRFPNRLRTPGAQPMHAIFDAGGAFTLVSRPVKHAIIDGKPAPMLAYIVERDGQALLNPLLRMQKGAHVRVRYWNALDETSIVHWHGLMVDTNNDGHPHYAVGSGETYDYHFTVANRAGTYWYHAHPHHLSAKQIALGLAGVLIVEDPEEHALRRALDLTLGATDIPLLIQDKRLTAEGAPDYAPGADDQFHGWLGRDFLVNLTPAPYLDCASRLYRLRLVNGSNARIYRLAFVHGAGPLEFHVIGADGGLIERPIAAREVFLSPGERADVVLDLRAASVGDRVTLASLPFDAMQFSAPGTAHASPAHADVPPNGAPLELMLLRVTRKTPYDRALPQTLSRIDAPALEQARVRRFALDHSKGIWRINGATYRMTDTAFAVKRATTEIWEFSNALPAMAHPIHVHGFQYRMLERRGSPEQMRRLAVDSRGLPPAELGWKDTVLQWPGETLRFAIDFTHPFPGEQVYMLQCHNLEHEAHGMMVNFRIEP